MSLHDFQHVLIALENNRIDTYCSLASYTWLLYDHMLTMGKEIELVWPTPWTLGKVLFFATAYFPLLDGAILAYFHAAPSSISAHTCEVVYTISAWLNIWGILVAELVLFYRTWAIWGRNSILAIGLLVLLCLLAIPVAVLSHDGLEQVQFGPSPSPRIESCWMTKTPGEILFIDYIVIVFFESVILALSLYRGVPQLRSSNSNLVVTLYRDGVLYYIYLIVFSLVNIIVLVIAPTRRPSLIFMQRILHSILTARLMLNLRVAVETDRAKRTLTSTSTDITLQHGELSMRAREQPRTRTVLSSVIIGVDTWFRDHSSPTQSSVEMTGRS